MDAPIGSRQTDSSKMMKPVKPSDVPFILLVGENDYNPGPVRPDSDEEGDLYRHYLIAGGAHSSKVFLPDPIDSLMLKAGRAAGDYPEFKMSQDRNQPNTVSDMNMDVFVNAAMENLHQWASDGIEAPYGPSKGEIKGTMSGMQFVPERDEWGNMTTGIRSPQLSVPVASYYGGANGIFSTDGGSMIYLDQEVLDNRYEGRDDYLSQYEAALDEMIQEGWILELDREKLLEIARNEPVFGNKSRDKERIEKTMSEIPRFTILSRVQTGFGEETWYQVSGNANMYGILHDNLIYCRRMESLPYVNAVRVAVPESVTGDVVLDLIFEGEEEKDVSQYLKAGTVYVGITADPEAAKEKGGSWKIPYKTNEPRKESGLVWDIISQTVSAVRAGMLFRLPSGGAAGIHLGADERDGGVAATYQMVFDGFDAYGLDSAMEGECVALNDIDKEILPVRPEAGIDTPDDDTNPPDDDTNPPDDDTNPPDHEINPPGSSTDSTDSGSQENSYKKDRSSRIIESDHSSGTWVKDAAGWWFRFKDGTWPASAWMYLTWNGTSSWYYFDSNGYMVTGWLTDGENRYYLHPVSDGTMGHLYTGWHLIDGIWYYFNEETDGTQGRLLRSAAVPDHFRSGGSGI